MKRKILSALLSAAMVVGLCGSVFAAESVENARADTTPPPTFPRFLA